jgi:hypothetical protein
VHPQSGSKGHHRDKCIEVNGIVHAVEGKTVRMGSDDEATSSTGYKILAALASLLGAFVARKALTSAWKLASGKEPPQNPAHPTVTWPEAVSWAVASGAVVGLARLAAQKKVADSFNRSAHDTPSQSAFSRR